MDTDYTYPLYVSLPHQACPELQQTPVTMLGTHGGEGHSGEEYLHFFISQLLEKEKLAAISFTSFFAPLSRPSILFLELCISLSITFHVGAAQIIHKLMEEKNYKAF